MNNIITGGSFPYIHCVLCHSGGEEICEYNFSSRELAERWCVKDLDSIGSKLVEEYRDCRDQSDIDHYMLSCWQMNMSKGFVSFFLYPWVYDKNVPRSERNILRVYRSIVCYKVIDYKLFVCYAYRFVKLTTVIEPEIKVEGVPYRAATSTVVEEELRGYDSFYTTRVDSYESGCIDMSLGKDTSKGYVYPYMTMVRSYNVSDDVFRLSDDLVT